MCHKLHNTPFEYKQHLSHASAICRGIYSERHGKVKCDHRQQVLRLSATPMTGSSGSLMMYSSNWNGFVCLTAPPGSIPYEFCSDFKVSR